MQKRALNVVLTGLSGTCLAGMLVAGVAAASDDNAPQQKNMPSTQPMAANEALTAKAQQDRKAAEKKAADKKAAEKKAAEKKKKEKEVILSGKTTASYFWDDGSGINGDTGAPAGGKPMQKGLFASPSWPLHTKVKVSYNGRTVTGFVGDRGPGAPSNNGVMLDLDTYTFRYLLDGKKPSSKYEAGTGEGHLKGLKWEVLEWGKGPGQKGNPRPM